VQRDWLRFKILEGHTHCTEEQQQQGH
jgi:hypothetical protein